ncbi:hypothetical protein M440DRAFT_1067486 [Trichoderma longibrachiatum ATCC 18648]|uniref:Uncharacterized protein n=1 Tax=Trichoderma longibrachiatum ATCC 18648 TaxID=983965 RepID=A0A2T4BWJ4_TRILO|nr:hypothetical protein M440DRAFT_1067486 [Trichoderma longibrachiatum ATCC 18648]
MSRTLFLFHFGSCFPIPFYFFPFMLLFHYLRTWYIFRVHLKGGEVVKGEKRRRFRRLDSTRYQISRRLFRIAAGVFRMRTRNNRPSRSNGESACMCARVVR